MGDAAVCTYEVDGDQIAFDYEEDNIVFARHDDGSLKGPLGNMVGALRKSESSQFRAPQALPTIAVILLGLMATSEIASGQALEFESVSAGPGHSCGVTTAGAAYCWGWNGKGGLGHGTNTDSNVPVAVSGGHTFASVSTGEGYNYSCGVTTAGAAYCWGRNGNGELGDGTNIDKNVPVAVSPP